MCGFTYSELSSLKPSSPEDVQCHGQLPSVPMDVIMSLAILRTPELGNYWVDCPDQIYGNGLSLWLRNIMFIYTSGPIGHAHRRNKRFWNLADAGTQQPMCRFTQIHSHWNYLRLQMSIAIVNCPSGRHGRAHERHNRCSWNPPVAVIQQPLGRFTPNQAHWKRTGGLLMQSIGSLMLLHAILIHMASGDLCL